MEATLPPHDEIYAAHPAAAGTRRSVAIWLLVCCALLAAMVVVGGLTRLTESGLSIVEWQPIAGALPPVTGADWDQLFDKYRQTPQFRRVNFDMTLADFKRIFWWEYAHRLLGRTIGLAYLLPLLYFLLRRRIDRGLGFRLGGIFLLGALQGALGWYMVRSGLVDAPRVSPYRLSAHLGLAFAIYAAMFWTALGLLANPTAPSGAGAHPRLRRFAYALTVLIFVQVLAGALVAGIRAGLAYNTFPLMNGHWAPPELFQLDPWYLNLFSNMATVQFDHRLVAWLLACAVPAFWLSALRVSLTRTTRTACHALLAATVLQIALGIVTLLLRVPLAAAAGHQAGALLLFTTALWVSHRLRAGA
ncbi:MAG TPA: COX15/CtaA family protein [Burkholderiales bacterium]|nr:COX15/CtaA family protein [Burkholderiales bacterium]